jgi:hypothetical protein
MHRRRRQVDAHASWDSRYWPKQQQVEACGSVPKGKADGGYGVRKGDVKCSEVRRGKLRLGTRSQVAKRVTSETDGVERKTEVEVEPYRTRERSVNGSV